MNPLPRRIDRIRLPCTNDDLEILLHVTWIYENVIIRSADSSLSLSINLQKLGKEV